MLFHTTPSPWHRWLWAALYVWLLQRMEPHKLALYFSAILALLVALAAVGVRSAPWNIICGFLMIVVGITVVMRQPVQGEESISLLFTSREL